MALNPDERKKLLRHGDLIRAGRIAKRSPTHMTRVNQGTRRDPVAEKWITRMIVTNHPSTDPASVFPPMPAVLQSA